MIRSICWLAVGSGLGGSRRLSAAAPPIKGWIDAGQVLSLAEPLKETGYGRYLIDLIQRVR